MKLNLFLLASIFVALQLCKAGPLRLHKRAAFYIANETACVVDNIVYSNGDPIPTDDPCEACKCRPPGFACVLKECRVKPGCRAVRHVGQCCPEYICDAPESNPLNENNALPSLNLLPLNLNDESILPVILPTPEEPQSSEILTDPPAQPIIVVDNIEETVAPVTVATDEPNEFQTTLSESSVSEEITLNPVVEENSSDNETPSSVSNNAELPNDETPSSENNNAELPNDESGNQTVDESGNKTADESEDKMDEESANKVLFNSDTDIKTDENSEIVTVKNEDPAEPSEEAITVDPQTTVANDEEPVKEAEVTEKPSETGSISTETPPTEKQVKNSAADNSKSLKLSDEESNESEKEESKTAEPDKEEIKADETVTQLPTESSSESEPAPTSESDPQSVENSAEESQNSPHSVLYSNDDKIKSESAETVTIVVHVKEKPKLTTETDFVSERVTPESETSATQANLLKSNEELVSKEVVIDPTEDEGATSTRSNFEAFPSSTEETEERPTTSSQSIDETLNEEAEGRSEETESSTSNIEENPTPNENTSDSERNEESSVATTTQNVSDAPESTAAEVRANEETADEPKTDEPRVTVIKIIEEPNVAINIKITTTSSETDISEKEKPTENESETVETTEGTKSEENVEENEPEVREDDSKPEEKEEIASTETVKETTPVEKVESTSAQTEEIKPEERSAEEESGEKTDTENAKPEEPLENKPEVTTEPRDQSTEGSTQSDAAKKDNE